MKTTLAFLAAMALSGAQAFVPMSSPSFAKSSSLSMAKYNSMDEILAKFPDDLPVLINFYDANTEGEIKGDIVRSKNLLKDRCTLVSIKRQDYPGE